MFGSGNADADLMFVGEAPGANEDKQGLPFVGQAGRLLDTLLGEIGLTRGDVFVANVTNADLPATATRCRRRSTPARTTCTGELELIEPKVVCTRNFATKLQADPMGITRLHGRAELRQLGPRRVRLYPLFHPPRRCTPSMLDAHRPRVGFLQLRARAAGAGTRAEPELVVPEPEARALV